MYCRFLQDGYFGLDKNPSRCCIPLHLCSYLDCSHNHNPILFVRDGYREREREREREWASELGLECIHVANVEAFFNNVLPAYCVCLLYHSPEYNVKFFRQFSLVMNALDNKSELMATNLLTSLTIHCQSLKTTMSCFQIKSPNIPSQTKRHPKQQQNNIPN